MPDTTMSDSDALDALRDAMLNGSTAADTYELAAQLLEATGREVPE